jgi:ribonucleoside-triphosphate reductase (formate)
MPTKKIPCEIYSRVVGYYQPVNQWNKAKQAEFKDRHIYDPTELVKTLEYNNVLQ